MNWWLLGVGGTLVFAATIFTALVYWSNWDLVTGKDTKRKTKAKKH
ncbi:MULTISPECIES: hypothetical protein [Gallibacterium]|nr:MULTISPECIES: hypothetical protein [Gallibacterium]WKS98601.1 hypothetical protein NYR30_07360 [Gallibacterium salpingitidis]